VLDVTDLFLFQLPSAFAVFVVGLTLFKLTEDYKISLLFRQFSFVGFLITMLFEANIEIWTFDFFAQLLLLAESRFAEKILISLCFFFYFFVFLYSVGGIMLFFVVYRRKIRNIFE
jgi:hypothetical protein